MINEFARTLVERKKLSKREANDFVGKLFDVVQQGVERDRLVKVKGLGTFKLIDVEARESVNVNTGERVLIEGHDKITFVPDTFMKELVNKPFSQFETVVLNDGVVFSDTPVETKKAEAPVSTEPITHDAMPLVDFGAEDAEEHPMLEIPEDSEVSEIPEEPVFVPEPEPIPEPESEPILEVEPEPIIPEEEEMQEIVEEKEIQEILEEEEIQTIPINQVVPETTVTPAEFEIPEEPEIQEQPIVSEDSAIQESLQTQEISEDADSDLFIEEPEKNNSWLKCLCIFLIGLIAGYLLGNYLPIKSFLGEVVKPSEPVVEEQTAMPAPIDSTAVGDTLSAEADTTAISTVDGVEEPVKGVESAPKVEEPVAKAESENKSAEPVDLYAAKDNRVRLGAYRIVGTDKVVKAKEGETISRISRFYLGPDMECYVEVYNNMKASDVLKAGQEVKIPKLQWKKKKAQ